MHGSFERGLARLKAEATRYLKDDNLPAIKNNNSSSRASSGGSAANSSAGRDWTSNRFEGKQTRVGVRYQAILPELLTLKQRATYQDPCPDEEVISLPTNVTPFLPSFASMPIKIPLTHPASRRAIRIRLDIEQLEQRRTRREFNNNESNTSDRRGEAASAAQSTMERQLTAIQQIERDRRDAKILFSAWSKILKPEIQPDTGSNDFEVPLMSLFIVPGELCRIFTDAMPQPSKIPQLFDLLAVETFLPVKKLELYSDAMLIDAETHFSSSDHATFVASVNTRVAQKRKRTRLLAADGSHLPNNDDRREEEVKRPRPSPPMPSTNLMPPPPPSNSYTAAAPVKRPRGRPTFTSKLAATPTTTATSGYTDGHRHSTSSSTAAAASTGRPASSSIVRIPPSTTSSVATLTSSKSLKMLDVTVTAASTNSSPSSSTSIANGHTTPSHSPIHPHGTRRQSHLSHSHSTTTTTTTAASSIQLMELDGDERYSHESKSHSPRRPPGDSSNQFIIRVPKKVLSPHGTRCHCINESSCHLCLTGGADVTN